MKLTKAILLITVIVLSASTGIAQKKKKRKNKKDEVAALRLFEGPELPLDQVARLSSPTVGKMYAYFITVDDKEITSRSLMSGPQEVLLMPGEHRIQMRFVSKGEIAIPVETFEAVNFDAGKSYVVKYDYTAGKGGYPYSTDGTRIHLWIEEEGSPNLITEITVDGFGRNVKKEKP